MGTPKENLADMERRRAALQDKLNGPVSVDEAAQIEREIDFLTESINRMRSAIHGRKDMPFG